MIFRTLRPAVFALDAERAHALSLSALAGWAAIGAPLSRGRSWPSLHTRVAGIDFANPLGLAAGADKDGRAIHGFHAIGFGAVEIGTLTPRPQAGNPQPRLFRLPEDDAVINRMGFNNGGLEAGLARAHAARDRQGVLGINVGANKDSDDRIADYAAAVVTAARHADYITINVSSPNTPGLRDLQEGRMLVDLLARCTAARGGKPLFLKVAPDLTPKQIDGIARASIEEGVDALIVGNTTVSRPLLASHHAAETGGLSGAPLRDLAYTRLVDFRRATGGAIPLIAAGGIGSGADAYARIRAGASLVQLYTALVFKGPGLPARILADLAALLARDDFAQVDAAVGID